MLKKLYLKNYLSFGEVTLDLKNSNNTIKKYAAIYGENGSGKTNLLSALSFLKKSIFTLSFQYKFNDIFQSKVDKDELFNLLSRFKVPLSLNDLLKNKKTVESKDNMVLHYEFKINNFNIIYKMVFDDNSIIEESFSCPINKYTVELFNIKKDNIKFNSNLFNNIEFKESIETEIKKYWGKHTLLSIFNNLFFTQNNEYIIENVPLAFTTALTYLSSIKVLTKEDEEINMLGIDLYNTQQKNLLDNLNKGEIAFEDINKLKLTETALNYYFTSLYSDIKSVIYKQEERENKIKYSLYLKKKINKKIVEVPFDLESTGTKKLLTLFPLFYSVAEGDVVFIDEIDTGIHDVLFAHIIKNIVDTSKGQLIFTTHNTLLQNSISPKYLYIINSNAEGEKEIFNITEFERIQNNHNITKRYLDGLYGGVPIPSYFDFQDIVSEVNDINE